MIEFFNNLNANPNLATALQKQGITELTQVQLTAIPEAIQNEDLVVQSETGTGKTLAYLIPLFIKIDASKKEMQAIILAPTHELVMQIIRQIDQLAQNSEIKMTSTPIIGNVNIERQIEKLKDKPNIIVGTPGRVLELIKDVKKRGLPIVLISHNMPHVFEVADRIHIHRLGRRLCVINPREYSMSDAVAFMTGAKEPPAEVVA